MIRIGNVYGVQFGSGYAGNVWGKEGIAPAIMTMQGGGREPMIIEIRDEQGDRGRQHSPHGELGFSAEG